MYVPGHPNPGVCFNPDPNPQTSNTKQVHESIYLGIEARRKDFKEYVIHHIATLSLLGGSYIYNFTRIGALVAVVHDAADRCAPTRLNSPTTIEMQSRALSPRLTHFITHTTACWSWPSSSTTSPTSGPGRRRSLTHCSRRLPWCLPFRETSSSRSTSSATA